MSKPIEPKFPKRRYNPFFEGAVIAPDGYYLIPAGTERQSDGDLPTVCAWTYARRLPEGQMNDDLPEQGAPVRDDKVTLALAEAAHQQAAQLREALHAVYENCRQNRNKGIGAGPLAMARTALTAAGVDLRAPLQWEGTPEAPPQFAPTDPRTLARAKLQVWGDVARNALERNTADAVRQAAEMARVAMEKAAAFSAEPSAPPAPEPPVSAHPDAPVLRMTHDGKVTTFGAIEAPAGCYLLSAGTELRPGDLRLKDTGSWVEIDSIAFVGNLTWATEQFCYARKLPPVEGRADG